VSDEVDTELGESLANPVRGRAPLGLIKAKHRTS
jgi:hypothetical protein